MENISDCYWRYFFFKDIGGQSPPGSGYIVLQYWGNRFGPPKDTPYYFIIVLDRNRVPSFRIGPHDDALQYGRLGILEVN